MPRHVVCLLTQVEVDPDDPAFSNPTKPIGYVFDEANARAVENEFGWVMREEGPGEFRHVVASPDPKHIVDVSLIQTVSDSGAIVIAGGGGGIPVVREADGTRHARRTLAPPQPSGPYCPVENGQQPGGLLAGLR